VKPSDLHLLSDLQLVDRILGGDSQAFRLVVQRTERLVAQIVGRMITRKEDHPDLAQISYNTCFDYLRKKKLVLAGDLLESQEEEHSLSNSTADEGRIEKMMEQKDRAVLLESCMEELPPVQRTLVSLYHQQELSYAEICTITNLPEGTVKNYLFRARRQLQTRLLHLYKKGDL
jgi:RNA polymerase sigma-70 factor (ECF subfamily)